MDAVSGVGDLPDGVVATVHGSGRYRVRLTGRQDQMLDGECSCPYGQDGNFCKHCVAVGLRLLRGQHQHRVSQPDLKAFLVAMDHAALVDLVWQYASEDAGLFQKLRLLAATAGDRDPDLAELRGQVEALRVEWVQYGDEDTYATGAQEILLALDRLLPEHADTVQPLLRRAVVHIGAAGSASEDNAPKPIRSTPSRSIDRWSRRRSRRPTTKDTRVPHSCF